MTTKDEALEMAIEALNNACIKIEKWTKGGKWTAGKEALAKCKEALKHQEVGDAEIKQMLNDIEYYQKRVEELEQPLTRDWKETIDERIAKDDKFKEALAQLAQEPVSKTAERDYNFMRDLAIGTEDILNEMLLAKPVAWMHRHAGEITEFNDFQSCQYCEPLYTHPAPSWQGLSDDEIQAIRLKTLDAVATNYEAYRAIEQALKEKNNVS